jgi:hypothetical protein
METKPRDADKEALSDDDDEEKPGRKFAWLARWRQRHEATSATSVEEEAPAVEVPPRRFGRNVLSYFMVRRESNTASRSTSEYVTSEVGSQEATENSSERLSVVKRLAQRVGRNVLRMTRETEEEIVEIREQAQSSTREASEIPQPAGERAHEEMIAELEVDEEAIRKAANRLEDELDQLEASEIPLDYEVEGDILNHEQAAHNQVEVEHPDVRQTESQIPEASSASLSHSVGADGLHAPRATYAGYAESHPTADDLNTVRQTAEDADLLANRAAALAAVEGVALLYGQHRQNRRLNSLEHGEKHTDKTLDELRNQLQEQGRRIPTIERSHTQLRMPSERRPQVERVVEAAHNQAAITKETREVIEEQTRRAAEVIPSNSKAAVEAVHQTPIAHEVVESSHVEAADQRPAHERSERSHQHVAEAVVAEKAPTVQWNEREVAEHIEKGPGQITTTSPSAHVAGPYIPTHPTHIQPTLPSTAPAQDMTAEAEDSTTHRRDDSFVPEQPPSHLAAYVFVLVVVLVGLAIGLLAALH